MNPLMYFLTGCRYLYFHSKQRSFYETFSTLSRFIPEAGFKPKESGPAPKFELIFLSLKASGSHCLFRLPAPLSYSSLRNPPAPAQTPENHY